VVIRFPQLLCIVGMIVLWTGLLVFICGVVFCALLRDQRRVGSIAAESRPVFDSENIIVEDYPVHNHEGLAADHGVIQRLSQQNRFRAVATSVHSPKALINGTIRENSSRLYRIVRIVMSRSVIEVKRFSLIEYPDYDIPVDILGWSLSRIRGSCRAEKWLTNRKRDGSSNAETDPSSFVSSKIPVRIHDAFVGIFRYFVIGAPDGNCGDGVDDKNEKTKTLKAKGKPIYPIALSIAGYFGMLAAWLSIGLCRRWWTGGLCFLGMIGGFGVAVFGGLIALDRIAGVF
jgi:hypothetical protein